MNQNSKVGEKQIADFLLRSQQDQEKGMLWQAVLTGHVHVTGADDQLRQLGHGSETPLTDWAENAIERLDLLGFDARPSPPDMGEAHGDLIRLWAGLKVFVDRKAHEICTGRDGDGQPVSANSRQTLALHVYTMAVQQRLNQIARKEGHSDEAVELAQLMVREWHIDQCVEYVAEYGLDRDLEPLDERQGHYQAVGISAAHRGSRRGRRARIPDQLL